jgi:hypothetical protein
MYPLDAYLNHTGFRLLQTLGEDERRIVLKYYYNLLSIRHPLDRLRAVYGNKMRAPGELNTQLLKRNIPIINNYFRSVEHKQVDFNPSNDTLTFGQFLRLLSDEFDSGFRDEHWLPVDELCRVCDVMYDAVFRVETLDEDMTQLYKHLRDVGETLPDHMVPQNAALNATNPDEKLSITTYVFTDVHSYIMDKLQMIYKKDFELFGYHWENNKRATCKLYNNRQTCC